MLEVYSLMNSLYSTPFTSKNTFSFCHILHRTLVVSVYTPIKNRYKAPKQAMWCFFILERLFQTRSYSCVNLIPQIRPSAVYIMYRKAQFSGRTATKNEWQQTHIVVLNKDNFTFKSNALSTFNPSCISENCWGQEAYKLVQVICLEGFGAHIKDKYAILISVGLCLLASLQCCSLRKTLRHSTLL